MFDCSSDFEKKRSVRLLDVIRTSSAVMKKYKIFVTRGTEKECATVALQEIKVEGLEVRHKVRSKIFEACFMPS